MKHLYLIIGPSGSGKTTLANHLEKDYGMLPVSSYTTRPKRSDDEKGHVFVTKEFFDKLNLVAYTKYNNYEYGVSKELLDISDLYVIDPVGAFSLINNYHDNRELRVIWLNTSAQACTNRMMERGDIDADIMARIKADSMAFSSYWSFKIMHSCPGTWISTDGKTPKEIEYEAWAYIDSLEQSKVVPKSCNVCGAWEKLKEMFGR